MSPPPPPSPALPDISSVPSKPCGESVTASISDTNSYLEYAGCRVLNNIYVSGAFGGDLVFPHLTNVKGSIYIDNVPAATGLKTPELTEVVKYIYLSNLAMFSCFLAPKLSSMPGEDDGYSVQAAYLYNGNTNLPCDLSGFDTNALPDPKLAGACCALP